MSHAAGRVVLTTPRLTLREMQASDLPFVTALLTDAAVMRFWPRVYTNAECADWIRRAEERYERDGYGYWLLQERTRGEIIGQAGVLATDVNGCREAALGYILHRAHWGRGFATEAAAACRDFVLDILGAPRCVALVRPANLPSLAVARRIGMSVEGVAMHADLEHLVLACRRDSTVTA